MGLELDCQSFQEVVLKLSLSTARWWLALVNNNSEPFISLLCSRIAFLSCCTLSGLVSEVQLRISSSSSPASSWEYGITGAFTLGFVHGRGFSLVWPATSIGKATVALCWDGEGGDCFYGLTYLFVPVLQVW